MSRQFPWRQHCPKDVRDVQLMTLNLNTFFLIRQNGPLAFTVQEHGRKKPVEIRIGDPHSCTCQQYRSTKDLCPHISWILLRKFKINVRDVRSYQLGMTSRELDEYFYKNDRTSEDRCRIDRKRADAVRSKVLPKRIKGTDVCPVCLEGFQNRIKPVTYCVYGCGNGVHVRCIWMVAKYFIEESEKSGIIVDHKDMLKCPLCRGDFDRLSELKLSYVNAGKRRIISNDFLPPLVSHPNVRCGYCETSPIVGNVYRCARCCQVILCASCLTSEQYVRYHGDHGFVVKSESNEYWKRVENTNNNTESRNRDAYYRGKLSSSTTHSSESLQAFKVTRSFLLRRLLCAFCSHFFHTNEIIVGTRCGHYVHRKCLIEQSQSSNKKEPTCPLDGIAIIATNQSGVYKSVMNAVVDERKVTNDPDGIPYQFQSQNRRQQQGGQKQRQLLSRAQARPTCGSLEVRINRMNLLERPSKEDWTCSNNNNNNNHNININNNKHKPIYSGRFTDELEEAPESGIRRKTLTDNRCSRRPLRRKKFRSSSSSNTNNNFTRSSSESAQSTRALGSRVNPLMTVLMAASSSGSRISGKCDDRLNISDVTGKVETENYRNNNEDNRASTSKRRYTLPLNIKSIELQADSSPTTMKETIQSSRNSEDA